MNMIELTTENFEAEVRRCAAPVYVVFTAEWCGFCHGMVRLLDKVQHELTDVKFCSVDMDKCPELTAKYSIRRVPTSLVFKGGELVNKQTGQLTKAEVYELLNRSPKENSTRS